MESKEVVTICKTGTGFSAHLENLPGVVTTGRTLGELKKNIYEAVKLHLDGMLEDGINIPLELEGDFELIFKMDVESLLDYYQGIITQSAIARLTGINIKQLNHYATGKSKPRPKQIKKIEKGLHDLGYELIKIQL